MTIIAAFAWRMEARRITRERIVDDGMGVDERGSCMMRNAMCGLSRMKYGIDSDLCKFVDGG